MTVISHGAPAPCAGRRDRPYPQRPFAFIMSGMATSTGRLRQPLGTHEQWTITDANEAYEVERWGKGYFSIAEGGSVRVHPTADPLRSIDLKQLADDLQARGIMLP